MKFLFGEAKLFKLYQEVIHNRQVVHLDRNKMVRQEVELESSSTREYMVKDCFVLGLG
jgi:hypothetical protein